MLNLFLTLYFVRLKMRLCAHKLMYSWEEGRAGIRIWHRDGNKPFLVLIVFLRKTRKRFSRWLRLKFTLNNKKPCKNYRTHCSDHPGFIFQVELRSYFKKKRHHLKKIKRWLFHEFEHLTHKKIKYICIYFVIAEGKKIFFWVKVYNTKKHYKPIFPIQKIFVRFIGKMIFWVWIF